MIVPPEVIMVIVGVLLAGFFSGSESGAYDLSRLRLRYRAREQGLAWANRLELLLDDLPNFVEIYPAGNVRLDGVGICKS